MLEDLLTILGVLSDSDVHFTPEFLTQLSWKRDKGSIYLGYFMNNESELKRAIAFTSSAHMRILEVINWCLDGALVASLDWMKKVKNMQRIGDALIKENAALADDI